MTPDRRGAIARVAATVGEDWIYKGDAEMNDRTKISFLLGSNALASAIAGFVVYYAIKDWPTRYADHSLSWSVVAFFVLFVIASVTGLPAAGRYARRKSDVALIVASVPILLLAAGLAIGIVKQMLTGDF